MYNIRLGYGCGIKATLLTASGEVCDLRRARYKGALLVLPNGSTMPCADVSVDDITNAMYVRLLGDRELTNIGKYGIVFNVKLANGVMYSSPVVMFGEVLDNAEMEYKELNISIAVTVTYLPSNVAYTGASPKISPNGTWLVYNDDINAYEDTGEPANYAGITADIQELQASFNTQNITGLVAVDWKTVGKNDSGEICVIGGDTEVAEYLAGYLKHNDYVQRSVLNEYATHEWVESKGYITEKDIPLNIGAFVNDKGYITLDAIAPYAKKGTTLGDYGIENAYTKSECEAAFFAATKIDNVTIKRDEGGFLYVASGGGGNAGIDEAQLADYLARNLYTTEGWVYSQLDKYALKSAIPTDYLTQSGEQDVYAVKNFIQGLKIGGLPIYKSQDKTIYIDGNLVVRGGITAFGTNETITPSIFEALPIDGATLKRTENGVLYVDTTVVGGGGTGGGISIADVESYLTTNGYATQRWVTGKGYITDSASIKGNAATANRLIEEVVTDLNNATVGRIFTMTSGYGSAAGNKPDTGWVTGLTLRHAQNGAYRRQLAFCYDSLYLRFENNTNWGAWRKILDDYNYSYYALPLSGGTVNGNVRINKFLAVGAASSSTNTARAQIHLVSSGANPCDLYFGADDTLYWSVTVRNASDAGGFNKAFALYDVTNSAYRMMMFPNGNLAIGGTTASEKLHVYGNLLTTGAVILPNNENLKLKNSAGASLGVMYMATSDILNIGYESSRNGCATYINGETLRFRVGSANAVAAVVLNNGYWGLNVTSPTERLHVEGNILATGGITATNSSDERLKRNLRKFNASKVLMSLGGVYEYEYIDSEVQKNHIYEGTHYGLIYQHVKGTKLDVMCHEREDGMGALNYIHPKFISLIAGATMDNISEVEKLKRKIRNLEAKVKQLENRA